MELDDEHVSLGNTGFGAKLLRLAGAAGTVCHAHLLGQRIFPKLRLREAAFKAPPSPHVETAASAHAAARRKTIAAAPAR